MKNNVEADISKTVVGVLLFIARFQAVTILSGLTSTNVLVINVLGSSSDGKPVPHGYDVLCRTSRHAVMENITKAGCIYKVDTLETTVLRGVVIRLFDGCLFGSVVFPI